MKTHHKDVLVIEYTVRLGVHHMCTHCFYLHKIAELSSLDELLSQSNTKNNMSFDQVAVDGKNPVARLKPRAQRCACASSKYRFTL